MTCDSTEVVDDNKPKQALAPPQDDEDQMEQERRFDLLEDALFGVDFDLIAKEDSMMC